MNHHAEFHPSFGGHSEAINVAHGNTGRFGTDTP